MLVPVQELVNLEVRVSVVRQDVLLLQSKNFQLDLGLLFPLFAFVKLLFHDFIGVCLLPILGVDKLVFKCQSFEVSVQLADLLAFQ